MAQQTTTTTTTNTKQWQECHSGQIEVMQIGEALIYAGRKRDMDDDTTWDLRIRMLDSYGWNNLHPLIALSHGADKLLRPEIGQVRYPPTLDIDWPDFGVPPLDRKWWDALVESIAKMGPVHIGLYCEGGHGRTGTALAILAALSGNSGNDDPVKWVRDRYCGEVVESYAQIEYIEEVTGVPVLSKPTSAFRSYGAGGAAIPTWTQDKDGKWVANWESKYGGVETSGGGAPYAAGPAGASIPGGTLNPGNTMQSGSAKELVVSLSQQEVKGKKAKK